MNYLICSTGRARSGVLASYLKKLECGAPDEFYERVRFDLYKIQENAAVQTYLEEYRVNGILGIKMVWSHVSQMHKTLGLTLKQFIDTYMPNPKYLFVVRDPIKQAVESVIYGMKKQELPFEKRHFDFSAATQRMTRIILGNTAWTLFFRKYDIEPICVDANKLEQDPIPVVQDILSALGVDGAIEKLSNNFKDSLMNDFRDEMCESILRRHVLMMNDIKIRKFL